jgi:hypothetical protein
MTWEIVAGAVASLVATVGVVIKVAEFRRDQPHLRVSLTPEALNTFEGQPRVHCVIEVVNVGRGPVTVQAIGLKYKDGRSHIPGMKMYSRSMPATLNEHQDVCAFIRREEINAESVLCAFADTNDGKRYKSPKYKHATAT